MSDRHVNVSGIGLGRLGEHFKKELILEASDVAVGDDGKQLVGEIHEHAVVSGGVV